MTINTDHLFRQAERLIAPSQAGAPRQADLRRAISSAYYGLFHMVLTAAADEFVGAARRGTTRYDLVYRKVDHSTLRKLCLHVVQRSDGIEPYAPADGFDRRIIDLARGIVELQQKRHSADYDPSYKVNRADAAAAIRLARSASDDLQRSGPEQRLAFLTLLLFPPR
ncbi:MAG: hypothetical protein AB7P52_11440 [Alphaproteobacteria bacterium]